MKRIILAAAVLGLFACKKDAPEANINQTASQDFHYTTTGDVSIDLQAAQHNAGAYFELYTANPENGGHLLLRGNLNEVGRFTSSHKLAFDQESVFLRSLSVGLPGDFTIPVTNGRVQFHFGILNPTNSGKRSGGSVASTPAPVIIGSNVYAYMGGFNSVGRPDYLGNPDLVSSIPSNDLTASLPEFQNIAVNGSSYLQNTNADLDILASTNLSVTFVDEKGTLANSLGYYVYNTQNPPASVSQIDTIFAVFPHVSRLNQVSGAPTGVLSAGDKVSLGSFSAGQSIGFVVVKNAFDGNAGSVAFGNTKYFTNSVFNPESSASLKKHTALLKDQSGNLYFGFEDGNRDNPLVDNDFNDILIRINTSNASAFNTSGVATLIDAAIASNDSDNDGVSNAVDLLPNNGNIAYASYLPYAGGYSSIAFEDLWPSQGDFDFNDLVVSLNETKFLNAQNMITSVEFEVFVRHNGASFNNGFGLSLPFPASQVQNVIGTNLTTGTITTLSSGLEAGHTNAVIIVFDDVFVNGDTLTVNVQLSTPYSLTLYNQGGNNPFLIANGDRGREIHLVDQEPTALANNSYFGLNMDDSDPSQNRYYVAGNGQPWAIEIYDSYIPPKENKSISSAYLLFDNWASSNGTLYQDWYQDIPGYRNPSNLLP